MEYLDLPRTADERETLLTFLSWQRATLARKVDGLSPGQLRQRAASPSPLSLLGLVRHMAEVERGWFRQELAGESLPDLYSGPGRVDFEFTEVDQADPEEALATWRQECAAADQVIAARDLETTTTTSFGREVSLRWILHHMVEEYSRHNGHADLIRERIDGATGY